MALDEALARCRVGDAAVLRLYAWSRPTVSFGRNEPALHHYHNTYREALGMEPLPLLEA